MNLDKYDLKVSENYVAFRFTSTGKNGKILKGVLFSFIEEVGVWNLAFGDIDAMTGEINDLNVSDNGDSEKILATVAQATLFFSDNYPDAIIYAEGSTISRTRLYQMGISKNFDEISKTFSVQGLLHDKWYSFQKNTNYLAFVIQRNPNTLILSSY